MRRALLFLFLLAWLLAPAAWAAVDVALQSKVYSGTAPDATWRRIDLPVNTASVLLKVDGAAYLDLTQGGYTDGGARSSGGWLMASGETYTLPIRTSSDRQVIWVAGSGASRTVTVIAFGSEAK